MMLQGSRSCYTSIPSKQILYPKPDGGITQVKPISIKKKNN